MEDCINIGVAHFLPTKPQMYLQLDCAYST